MTGEIMHRPTAKRGEASAENDPGIEKIVGTRTQPSFWVPDPFPPVNGADDPPSPLLAPLSLEKMINVFSRSPCSFSARSSLPTWSSTETIAPANFRRLPFAFVRFVSRSGASVFGE